MTLEHVSLPGSSPTGPVWLNFPWINGTPEWYEWVYKKRADRALSLSHSYLFRWRKRDEKYGDFSTQLESILHEIDRDKPLILSWKSAWSDGVLFTLWKFPTRVSRILFQSPLWWEEDPTILRSFDGRVYAIWWEYDHGGTVGQNLRGIADNTGASKSSNIIILDTDSHHLILHSKEVHDVWEKFFSGNT